MNGNGLFVLGFLRRKTGLCRRLRGKQPIQVRKRPIWKTLPAGGHPPSPPQKETSKSWGAENVIAFVTSDQIHQQEASITWYDHFCPKLPWNMGENARNDHFTWCFFHWNHHFGASRDVMLASQISTSTFAGSFFHEVLPISGAPPRIGLRIA